MRKIPLAPMVVFANLDTYRWYPATGWMNAADHEMIRDALEALNMPASGALTATIGMQTANNPDAPDVPAVALASSRTTDGMTWPVAPVDKSATTDARQLVRYGYLVKNTTATDTTLRMVWLGGFVEAGTK